VLKDTVTVAKILTPTSLLALLVLIFTVDPFEAGTVALVLFLISLGIFLFGSLILIKGWKKKAGSELNPVYLRRSGLIVLLLLVLLWLRAGDSLFWWNTLFFILLVISFEFYLSVQVD